MSSYLLAHGVGSRGDLPLPLWMFTWAAALALGLSFVALGVLWKEPRLVRAAAGRQLLDSGSFAIRLVLAIGRAAALGLLGIAIWAGLFGTDSEAENILPVTLYVIVWVGAQLLAGLVGDLWQAINPVGTIARGVEALAVRAGLSVADPPAGLGHLPAAAGLFVFLFFELAHPSGTSPRVLAFMLVAHLVVSVVLAAKWGAAWVAEHEPFSALFAMVAAMAPLYTEQRDPTARYSPGAGTPGPALRVRAPMSGLATMPVLPGTLATLLIVLGGTTFDGFVESEAGRDLFGRPSGWGGAAILTVGLILSILLVTALFGVGIGWTCKVTGHEASFITDKFTPSLVPIVFGYAIAHYAQLLIDETQTFWFRLSDPAGKGWDLFGAADGTINFTLIGVDLIAWVQVLAILFGHIGAVLVAHDSSMQLAVAAGGGETDALRSQYVMLLVMVLYSCLGLWLLLNA